MPLPNIGFVMPALPIPPTIRMMPLARFCGGKPCCTIDVKSELIRFGELTRMRNGDMAGVGPVGVVPLLR